MTKGLLKDFIREIRKTLGRFLSIFLIVLIGVSFFSGVKASAPDMRHSADMYFDEYNMTDIRVLSTLGLTDDDIEEISKIEGVESVQPGYFVDAVSMVRSAEYVFRIHSLPEKSRKGENYINAINLTEGRLPEKSGECVLEKSNILNNGLKIGDTITLSSGTEEDIKEKSLKENTFTIVGIGTSPYYLSYEKGSSDIGSGSVDFFLYIPEEDFKYDVYLEALIAVKGASELNCYSDDYEDLVGKVLSDLENLGEDRSTIRLKEVKDLANKELDKAKKEYADAKKAYEEEIEKADKDLDDALEQIASGKTKINIKEEQYNITVEQAEADLREAKQQLDEGQREYDNAVAEYDAAMAKYSDDLADIDRKVKALTAMRDRVKKNIEDIEDKLASGSLDPEVEAQLKELLASYTSQLKEIDEQIDQLNELNNYIQQIPIEAEKELAAAKEKLDKGYEDYYAAQEQLEISKAQAQREFAESKEQLNSAENQYDNAKVKYKEQKASGEKKLDEAYVKLIKAENEIEYISEPEWYVLDRSTNYGYVDYTGTADRINAIANIFPIFFFLVAALVCLTTMTRMVDEQRGVIGTYKALGYKNSSIALKYILYAAIASTLGGVLGAYIGVMIFPKVIFIAYSMMYTLPYMSHVPQPILMVVSVAAGILVTTFAAGSACYNELRETPSALLRPKAPKAGKKILLERIPFFWSKLSFTSKVTARNLFRYKKRLFMTIIGISGCAALLLAGFGLNNSISQVVNKQYKEIFNYNLDIRLNSDISDEKAQSVIDNLQKDEQVKSLITTATYNVEMSTEEDTASVTLIIPEKTEGFTNYITLRDRTSQKGINLPESGIVITEKLSKELGLGVGDTVTVNNGEGATKKITVVAITENYVYHYAYMSKDAYLENFSIIKDPNGILVKLNDTSSEIEENIGRQLIKNEGISSVTYFTAAAETFDNQIKSLNSIVYVIIVCAGLLAFVVMYNLTNINIGERIREIATIKVLGFYNREVSSYVYRENIILSIMGAVVGLILGIFLHRYIMVSIEQDGIMFGNYIQPISFLYAFGITMIFSILVNLVMYRRLVKIPMVESLKSVE